MTALIANYVKSKRKVKKLISCVKIEKIS